MPAVVRSQDRLQGRAQARGRPSWLRLPSLGFTLSLTLHALPFGALLLLGHAASEPPGAAPGKLVVAYCHIGQQATAVWFAARLLGREARLYDGSYVEWDRLTEYPVERGTP